MANYEKNTGKPYGQAQVEAAQNKATQEGKVNGEIGEDSKAQQQQSSEKKEL